MTAGGRGGLVAAFTAADLYLATFGVFQFLLAMMLLRRDGLHPIRWSSAALLILNGMHSILVTFLAEFAWQDSSWPSRLATTVDEPTAVFLLALGFALLAPVSWNRQPRHRRLAFLLGTTAAAMVVMALAWDRDWFWHEVRPWLHDPLLLTAYGAVAVGCAERLASAPDAQATRLYGLLWTAFMVRIVEFAWVLSVYPILTGALDWTAWQHLWRLAYLVVVLYAIGRGATAALRRRRTDAPAWATSLPLAAILAGLAFGIGETAAGVPAYQAPLFLLTSFSLIVVRPWFLGLALEPRDTLRITACLGAALVAYVAAKAVLAALFEVGFFELGAFDLFAGGMALMAAFATRMAWDPHGRARPPPERDPTKAERVIDGLRLADDWIDAATLAGVAGLTRNNLPGEVRRATTALERTGARSGPFIEERIVGVRGRKQYRLTAAGRRAARNIAIWA